ncbi:hypothetical protein [Coraliomargarita sinensis]|uniref:hypothetical protein n=1 Tax=Coraliomargarita sinensis TaxID=2174842 RepID=UPI001304AA8C|nr:hypothetical protein [Coraliomargarita sinensis]
MSPIFDGERCIAGQQRQREQDCAGHGYSYEEQPRIHGLGVLEHKDDGEHDQYQ